FLVCHGAGTTGLVAAQKLTATGWPLPAPACGVGATVFWLWVPGFLMPATLGLRALLPGALMAALVIGGATATSPLWLPPTLNANGKAFGSFGVVLTLVGWVFILITISLVCAVFSPVWAAWRADERTRGESGLAEQE